MLQTLVADVFVVVFAVNYVDVYTWLSEVRILVVCNLPTGSQLQSASFSSTNYMYTGPQVRTLPAPLSLLVWSV